MNQYEQFYLDYGLNGFPCIGLPCLAEKIVFPLARGSFPSVLHAMYLFCYLNRFHAVSINTNQMLDTESVYQFLPRYSGN
jgi:hypothetical protein